MKLQTERLVIRNIEPKDGDNYTAFYNSEFVMKYNCMRPLTKEDVDALIEKKAADDGLLVIALRETDELIGAVQIGEDSLRWEADSLEMSYWLGERFIRKGYMTEALQEVIRYLFEEKKLYSITVRVFSENSNSIRLMERLGFQKEGQLHHAVKAYGGIVYDDCLFSLKRPEQAAQSECFKRGKGN